MLKLLSRKSIWSSRIFNFFLFVFKRDGVKWLNCFLFYQLWREIFEIFVDLILDFFNFDVLGPYIVIIFDVFDLLNLFLPLFLLKILNQPLIFLTMELFSFFKFIFLLLFLCLDLGVQSSFQSSLLLHFLELCLCTRSHRLTPHRGWLSRLSILL